MTSILVIRQTCDGKAKLGITKRALAQWRNCEYPWATATDVGTAEKPPRSQNAKNRHIHTSGNNDGEDDDGDDGQDDDFDGEDDDDNVLQVLLHWQPIFQINLIWVSKISKNRFQNQSKSVLIF